MSTPANGPPPSVWWSIPVPIPQPCDGSHVAPSSQAYIAEQIPNASLHVFGADVASSHFPFLENPAAFNAVVEDFLSRE